MKHIYVNLKRFDIPKALSGVNTAASVEEWAQHMIAIISPIANKYQKDSEFVVFLPELHLLQGIKAAIGSHQLIGSQGCYFEDVSQDGNFGAFTTHRPASILRAIGCAYVLIGHYEERKYIQEVLKMAHSMNEQVVDELCQKEIDSALRSDLKVVYCIGERAEEKDIWKEVLHRQITVGLLALEKENIVLAYEPIWSIGPGKIPPDSETIRERIRFIKEVSGEMEVVYGGGLKQDNAIMLSEIEEVDGGLIALTRFKGDIGFYSEEYADIVQKYLKKGML